LASAGDKKIVAFLLGFFFFVIGLIVGLLWSKANRGKDYWKFFAIGAVINVVWIVAVWWFFIGSWLWLLPYY
jgi:hypothetical protein